VKRERNLGNLLARALSGEELQMHPDDEEVLVRFEGIVDAYENGWSLEEGDLEFLILMGKEYTLPGREGQLPERPGLNDDDVVRPKKCAAYLVEMGKREYLQLIGGTRLRNKTVDEKLCKLAEHLVKQKWRQAAFDWRDIYGLRPVSEKFGAYVEEQLPDAEQKMRAKARSLARQFGFGR
jgi:hypothetical protein